MLQRRLTTFAAANGASSGGAQVPWYGKYGKYSDIAPHKCSQVFVCMYSKYGKYDMRGRYGKYGMHGMHGKSKCGMHVASIVSMASMVSTSTPAATPHCTSIPRSKLPASCARAWLATSGALPTPLCAPPGGVARCRALKRPLCIFIHRLCQRGPLHHSNTDSQLCTTCTRWLLR